MVTREKQALRNGSIVLWRMQLGNRKKTSLKSKKSLEAGFTLLEMLIVVAMIGIVGMFAAPGWLAFLDGNRLDTASNELYAGIKEAQIQAQAQNIAWQFSVRANHDTIEWATPPVTTCGCSLARITRIAFYSNR